MPFRDEKYQCSPKEHCCCKTHCSRRTVYRVKNLTVKRPGSGISPMLWPEVIGQLARRAFAVDELIEL